MRTVMCCAPLAGTGLTRVEIVGGFDAQRQNRHGSDSASSGWATRLSSVPMPPLEGCLAKIARAEGHPIELGIRVRQYIDTQPFRILGEYQSATNEYIIRAEAVPDYGPVPSDLVLIAGEVAHQLRSALDHLVWDLVVQNTGAPPPGTDSGYPIFLTADGYNRRAPQKIRGVSPSAANRIFAAQPFHLSRLQSTPGAPAAVRPSDGLRQ